MSIMAASTQLACRTIQVRAFVSISTCFRRDEDSEHHHGCTGAPLSRLGTAPSTGALFFSSCKLDPYGIVSLSIHRCAVGIFSLCRVSTVIANQLFDAASSRHLS